MKGKQISLGRLGKVHFEMEKQLHPRVSTVRKVLRVMLKCLLNLCLRFLFGPSVCSSRNRLKGSENVRSEHMVYSWESQRPSHALHWDGSKHR